MRKKLINSDTIRPRSQEEWLDLEEIARVEVTSEDPNFPIEAALAAAEGSGWRAAEKGKQIIRIVLDNPRTLHSWVRSITVSENSSLIRRREQGTALHIESM